MKKFTCTLIKALFSIFIFYLLIYGIFFLFSCKKNNSNIYIWGDSQTYFGLDIENMHNKMYNSYFSFANQGAGIYDFDVFSYMVPAESTCIIGFSECCFLRNIDSDYNRSGFLFLPVYHLIENGYKLGYLYSLGQNNNWLPKIHSRKEHELFSYRDSIVITEPLNIFSRIYNQDNFFFQSKQTIFLNAISRLKSKKCKIICIYFPFQGKLRYLANHSKNRNLILSIYDNTVNILEIDSVLVYKMPENYQYMHDYTHLNIDGAQIVSQLVDSLVESKRDVFLKINL